MDTSSRIPRAKQPVASSKQIPKQAGLKTSADGLKFSFEALDKTEYFGLDGTCPNWSSDLFDMLKDVSGHTAVDMISGGYQRKYRVHNHEGVNPPSKLPEGVALKDCYQIRISTAKGGIHGVFGVGNVFYVIWLDPLHNMYPDDRFGGLRKVKPASSCCKDRDEELAQLREELKAAKAEAKEWEEFASSLMDGNKSNSAIAQ